MLSLVLIRCAANCLVATECPEHPNIPGYPDVATSKALTDAGWIYFQGSWFCDRHQAVAWQENHTTFEALRRRAIVFASAGATCAIAASVTGIVVGKPNWLILFGIGILVLLYAGWIAFFRLPRMIHPRKPRLARRSLSYTPGELKFLSSIRIVLWSSGVALLSLTFGTLWWPTLWPFAKVVYWPTVGVLAICLYLLLYYLPERAFRRELRETTDDPA